MMSAAGNAETKLFVDVDELVVYQRFICGHSDAQCTSPFVGHSARSVVCPVRTVLTLHHRISALLTPAAVSHETIVDQSPP
jgi:hypothetical protein